jgi:hypothetical protein
MEPQLRSVTALSRRRFVQAAAAAAAGAAAPLAWPPTGVASGDDDASLVPPKPIPGGLELPDGTRIHVWPPGDPSVTLPFTQATPMGFDVDPSTITDFRGFSAVAFHVGAVTGSDGATYDLETDMRAFKGTYVGADDARHSGAFAFI